MTETVRVLVVDDAAFMRRTLTKLLRQAPDVEVVGEARNGREAISLFTATRPDVICLDVDMPEMDGVTALKHIMSIRPTPVIVVSSMTDRDNVPFELFRLGVIDFFPKPSSLVGAVEDQTRLLLYLVRNARHIRVENLARAPVHRAEGSGQAGGSLRHLLVVGGALGSVGALVRLLSLLSPRVNRGIGMLCMVPLHEAIGASFQASLAGLFGWSADWLETSLTLQTGRIGLLRPGSRLALDQTATCQLESMGEPSLDHLFAVAGRALGPHATMVLLAGGEPDGVGGLAAAHACGSHCFVQDPRTALFTFWQPTIPAGVELLSLESVAAGILELVDHPDRAAGAEP